MLTVQTVQLTSLSQLSRSDALPIQLLVNPLTPDSKQKPLPFTQSPLWQSFVLLGPVLAMGAGVLMTAAGLGNVLFKKSLERMRNSGKLLQAVSTILVNINGIAGGIVAQQPAMVVANSLQMLFAPRLFTSNTATQETVANFIQSVLGGVYTLGLANEIANKDGENKASKNKISYDMTPLRRSLNFAFAMPLPTRLKMLGSELMGLLGFTVSDHVRLLQHTTHGIKQLIQHPKEALNFQSIKEVSADRSRVAVLLWYAGNLPVIFNKGLISNPVLFSMRFLGNMVANAATFSLALNHQSLKGRAPLIGAPLSVIGTAMGAAEHKGWSSIWRGIGALGEAINNLMFSEVAVNGLQLEMPPVEASSTHPQDKASNSAT